MHCGEGLPSSLEWSDSTGYGLGWASEGPCVRRWVELHSNEEI
jgi:hypothetical protein